MAAAIPGVVEVDNQLVIAGAGLIADRPAVGAAADRLPPSRRPVRRSRYRTVAVIPAMPPTPAIPRSRP